MGTNPRYHTTNLSQLDIEFKEVLHEYTKVLQKKPSTDTLNVDAEEWAVDMRKILVCAFPPLYMLK
jgi:hypothetical protein